MPDWVGPFLVGFLPAAAAGVLGWLKWLHELRERRFERAGRSKAEAELSDNRRRAEGPHLSLVHLHSAEVGVIPPGEILGTRSYRIPSANTPVALVVINLRRSVYDVTHQWIDGETAGAGVVCPNQMIVSNPMGAGASASIIYTFNPSKIGRTMRLRIFFTTETGVQMHYDYASRHGHAEFNRLDPA